MERSLLFQQDRGQEWYCIFCHTCMIVGFFVAVKVLAKGQDGLWKNDDGLNFIYPQALASYQVQAGGWKFNSRWHVCPHLASRCWTNCGQWVTAMDCLHSIFRQPISGCNIMLLFLYLNIWLISTCFFIKNRSRWVSAQTLGSFHLHFGKFRNYGYM